MDGAIDEDAGMSMGIEGESSQVVCMMIMYRKRLRTSSRRDIKDLVYAKFVS